MVIPLVVTGPRAADLQVGVILPAAAVTARPVVVAILPVAADRPVGDRPVVGHPVADRPLADLRVVVVMGRPVADLLRADLLVGDRPVVNRQGLRSSVASCPPLTTGRSRWDQVARRSIRWLRLATAGTR